MLALLTLALLALLTLALLALLALLFLALLTHVRVLLDVRDLRLQCYLLGFTRIPPRRRDKR